MTHAHPYRMAVLRSLEELTCRILTREAERGDAYEVNATGALPLRLFSRSTHEGSQGWTVFRLDPNTHTFQSVGPLGNDWTPGRLLGHLTDLAHSRAGLRPMDEAQEPMWRHAHPVLCQVCTRRAIADLSPHEHLHEVTGDLGWRVALHPQAGPVAVCSQRCEGGALRGAHVLPQPPTLGTILL